MHKIILFLINQKVQHLLSFCLFILLAVFGYFHATKGIDLTDEGMYVSTAMRFSMGDIPFRDEFMSILTQFNVLLSPVFMIYPDISLLQMRCLGLVFHTVSLFLLFLFLSRYGPPFLVALLCSVMFLLNNFYGIVSPSYNSLSSDFSIISLTLWLFAVSSDKKSHRFLFSVLGGFLFSLAVLSYSSLVLVICIPLALIIIAIYSFERPSTYIHSSIIFVGTFGIIISIVFLITASFGLLPDVMQGFLEAPGTSSLGADGLFIKAGDLFQEFYDVAPKGLIALAILSGVLFFAIVPGKGKRDDFIYGILGVIVIVAILFIFPLLLSQRTNLVTLAFAAPLALLMLFFHYEPDVKSTADVSWNKVRNIAIAWGFISALVYGMSSGMSLYACLLGATPLFVVGMIALYRILDNYAKFREIGTIRSIMLHAIVFTTAVTFLIPSVSYYYKYIYNEPEIERLTARFDNPRLAGIYSTPEKVSVLDELLRYLNGKVKPGDYFLAYNHIPMLYFLTHTRPAYGAVWARDDWPISIRKRLLGKMIKNNRIPEYCVRMLALSHGGDRNWKRGMPYDEDAPLDSFVNSNYYLEKIMYPFEIWHRGQGPKLRIFDQMEPDFESSFIHWKGPDTINMHNLSQTVAPLMLQGFMGDFNFSRIYEIGGNVVRVSPYRKGEKKDGFVIQFGYTLNKNGFDLKIHPGQEVIFIISARLSNRMKRLPEFFIQDKTDKWERNSVIIDNTSWDQYIVSKKIRDGLTNVCFGINWKPESEKEWLEIKHVRIYVDND